MIKKLNSMLNFDKVKSQPVTQPAVRIKLMGNDVCMALIRNCNWVLTLLWNVIPQNKIRIIILGLEDRRKKIKHHIVYSRNELSVEQKTMGLIAPKCISISNIFEMPTM